MGCGVQGLGCGVQGLGCVVQGLGCGVQVLGYEGHVRSPSLLDQIPLYSPLHGGVLGEGLVTSCLSLSLSRLVSDPPRDPLRTLLQQEVMDEHLSEVNLGENPSERTADALSQSPATCGVTSGPPQVDHSHKHFKLCAVL